MSNNTNDANADGGQDGRESIHMANLATIRVNGLQALTPAVKAEIMQYWFEEQLGKIGYEYDVNVSRSPPLPPVLLPVAPPPPILAFCFEVKRAVCANAKANAKTQWRRRFDAYFLPESAVAQLRLAETDANTDLTIWNASGDANASTTNLEDVDLERGEGAGVGGDANRPLTIDEFIKVCLL